MSGRSSDARVVDLAAARERPAGARTVERLCDGRRKGDHGNRASEPMKAAAITQLREALALRGTVTAADKQRIATFAGVTVRALNRWWHTALRCRARRPHRWTAARGREPGRPAALPVPVRRTTPSCS